MSINKREKTKNLRLFDNPATDDHIIIIKYGCLAGANARHGVIEDDVDSFRSGWLDDGGNERVAGADLYQDFHAPT